MRKIFGLFMLMASGAVFAQCPAFPQFPDANCTGWAHTGVTLTNHTASCTLSTPNATYDSKRFNCNVTLAADGITIKRSEINGQLFLNSSNRRNLLIEDVKIDGGNTAGNAAGQCVGGNSGNNGGATAADFVLRRVDIQGCAQGVYGRGWTLEDSYIHGLYLEADGHTEPILGHTGDIVIRHNYLDASYRLDNGTSGGGMSAVIALYTHSSFWGDIDDVLITQNYITTADSGRGQAGYCVYGGDGGPGDNGNATNTRVYQNRWDRGSTGVCGWAGPVIWIAEGAGSCWSDNSYIGGGVISGGPACAVQQLFPNPPTDVTVTQLVP